MNSAPNDEPIFNVTDRDDYVLISAHRVGENVVALTLKRRVGAESVTREMIGHHANYVWLYLSGMFDEDAA